jgi:hypothetical protein
MTITITEIDNPHKMKMKPIKERQDIYVPDIVNQNISRRNGMVYCLTGSGGSGKSSLMLNLFKDKNMYRQKFHNIFYFCPISSFTSVDKHPFENHEKVYHELTIPILQGIYNELVEIKTLATKPVEKKRRKEKKKQSKIVEDSDDAISESDEEEEKHEIEYSAIIIDDFADTLKDMSIQKFLNKFIIKARHLCCSFFITLQSYYYCPKIIRKQLTYITIFKPKNIEEWDGIAKELLNLNKDDGLKLHDYVFDEPYTHLDIDTVTNKIYKNFNMLEIHK